MKNKPQFPEKANIDPKDIDILRILQEEGRIPILELGKRVKLSHETVRYRLRKLEQKKIIKKYTVLLDQELLGYPLYSLVLVSLGYYTAAEWDQFREYLVHHPQVTAVEKITGTYDLLFVFQSQNTEQFDVISHTIKTQFSKIIKDWQTLIITKEFKWKELPF